MAMEWSAILGALLLVVIIFLAVRSIINSIRLFFVVLLVLFFVVLFFDISLSDVTVWLSSQERWQWLVNVFVNTLLFSFAGS